MRFRFIDSCSCLPSCSLHLGPTSSPGKAPPLLGVWLGAGGSFCLKCQGSPGFGFSEASAELAGPWGVIEQRQEPGPVGRGLLGGGGWVHSLSSSHLVTSQNVRPTGGEQPSQRQDGEYAFASVWELRSRWGLREPCGWVCEL